MDNRGQANKISFSQSNETEEILKRARGNYIASQSEIILKVSKTPM